MTLRRIRLAALAGASIVAFSLAHAAPGSSQEPARDEIGHLLEYVAASPCTFVRNGNEYPAQKAHDHLADKYRFAGSRIASAEQFIEYLATKSSFSGKPYHVHCGKSDEESGPWLNAELQRYRKLPRTTQAAR